MNGLHHRHLVEQRNRCKCKVRRGHNKPALWLSSSLVLRSVKAAASSREPHISSSEDTCETRTVMLHCLGRPIVGFTASRHSRHPRRCIHGPMSPGALRCERVLALGSICGALVAPHGAVPHKRRERRARRLAAGTKCSIVLVQWYLYSLHRFHQRITQDKKRWRSDGAHCFVHCKQQPGAGAAKKSLGAWQHTIRQGPLSNCKPAD